MKYTKIENFKGFEIELKFADILKRNGQTAARELKAESPRGVRKDYYKGWESYFYIDPFTKEEACIVWNKAHWQLTWLIENGHLITNKIGGVGWASPNNHIARVRERRIPKFIKDMKNVEIEIK